VDSNPDLKAESHSQTPLSKFSISLHLVVQYYITGRNLPRIRKYFIAFSTYILMPIQESVLRVSYSPGPQPVTVKNPVKTRSHNQARMRLLNLDLRKHSFEMRCPTTSISNSGYYLSVSPVISRITIVIIRTREEAIRPGKIIVILRIPVG